MNSQRTIIRNALANQIQEIEAEIEDAKWYLMYDLDTNKKYFRNRVSSLRKRKNKIAETIKFVKAVL
jgi:hypothetical protein